jgi:UDP-N-acetylmuramoyl-L-alanyl-D-glutamate--2,6-diaminopimelate ligase
MQLSDLARVLKIIGRPDLPDTQIDGIAYDSRQVQPGYIFVALTGGSVDGHRYIGNALEHGAVAVIGTQPLSGLAVPYLQVGDSRLAMAQSAAAFYGFPSRQLTVIGVTGTDGKTTTVNLIYSILQAAGIRTGMISTVNAIIDGKPLDTGFHVTTPEAIDVQRYLAQMVAAGQTHVVLEATSHGLAQQRVAACNFDIAAVTNITHEHLDFHGSYSAYRQAKAQLFSGLEQTEPKAFQPRRGAVLNRDDKSYAYLTAVTKAPQLTYGFQPGADIYPRDISQTPTGMHFTAVGCDLNGAAWQIPVTTPLVGSYNIANCLAAIGVCTGIMGIEAAAVQVGIFAMQGIPGRNEAIDLGQDFSAIVDFAHTPNALQSILRQVRQMTGGRVIAVFGSAGLRDRAKRRLMAEVSAQLADITILTAEDPRTESLAAILAQMVEGAEAHGAVEGQTLWRVPDRREAIRTATRLAQPGDLVVCCGKGHEQSMCFGQVEYPWDDRTALRAALAELLHISGPEMPFLPDPE